MKRINLLGIVALVSLVLSACGAPVAATATLPAAPTDTLTPLQPATPTVGNAPLTTQQLRNMQYSLPFYNRTVSLTDGTYQKGTGSDSYSAMLLDNAVAFGDLDNDGIADAAVVVAENGGGSGEFESLVAVLDQVGTPVQAGVVELGDRVQINSVVIQNGQIVLKMLVQGPNDPLCCPSLPVTETYILAKGNLVLVHLNSQTTDGRDRAIQIESPTAGSKVGSSVEVKGSVSIAPFENTLGYRLYDEANSQIDEGSITVAADSAGAAGTFDATIDLSKVASGSTFRLVLLDSSAADGSTLALDSVELVKE
jgi:hypothetical protein